MRVAMLIPTLLLVSCASAVPPKPQVVPEDHSGREAVIAHDYNGDGVNDIYAIKCSAMLDGRECEPGAAWTCGVVVVDGETSDTLYEKAFCLHRIPDSFGARYDNHKPVIQVNGTWYEIGDKDAEPK